MRFTPFKLADYPYIAKDLEDIRMDLSIARLGKNAIKLPRKIIFSANYADGMRQIEVPLDEEGYRNAELSVPEKMCLRRIMDLLEKADAADMTLLQRKCGSQFEVVSVIRAFDQNFGGARFVNLARELIETHMDVCLYPFMAVDLVSSIFLAYNKNLNRDVDGFLDALLDFATDFVQKDRDLQELFMRMQERSTDKIFLSLSNIALGKPVLAGAMRRLILHLLAAPYDYRANFVDVIPAETIAAFPKEDLILFFQNTHEEFFVLVERVFEILGDKCEPEYFEAYQRNNYFDMDLLLHNPVFAKLHPDAVSELEIREWLSNQVRGYRVVERFEEIDDAEEQRRFLRLCEGTGWKNLALALAGEAFSTRGMDFDTFFDLLPHMNLELEKNRQQAVAFVRDYIDYHPAGTEDLLLKLHDPAFTEVIRDAIGHEKIRDRVTEIILADRFHCAELLGLKEWR